MTQATTFAGAITNRMERKAVEDVVMLSGGC